MIDTNITAPQSKSASGTYGLFFQEGEIIHAARGGSFTFYKQPDGREAYYYFNTTDANDYVGRTTGKLLQGAGGYYLEVQRPKPLVGFIPGTLLPAFGLDTGYIFVGEDVNYFYDTFSIEGKGRTGNGTVIGTTSTNTGTDGTVTVTKTRVPDETPPPTLTTVPPQPKGPMYALIAVLVLAVVGIAYLSFKKPTK